MSDPTVEPEVTDDEPAQWYHHWEDGASREYRGLREDDERLARERGTL